MELFTFHTVSGLVCLGYGIISKPIVYLKGIIKSVSAVIRLNVLCEVSEGVEVLVIAKI